MIKLPRWADMIGLFLATYALAAFLPFAPLYLSTYGLQVAGNGQTVIHDRKIRQSFLGSYSVLVRSVDTSAVVCDATGGPFTSRADDRQVKSWKMADWAPSDSRCADLPQGEYFMQTCWTAVAPLWGFLPPKSGCSPTHIFKVEE